MSYLMHFNPNHDPKNGRFTYIKNNWAVRKGYQNKDGSLTDSGKKALDTRRKHLESYSKVEKEADKLLAKNKKLKRDFGGYGNVDDEDAFESTAREYGLDTKAFVKAVKERDQLIDAAFKDREYSKWLKAGEKMYGKMKDLDPDFWKRGYMHHDSGADLAGAFIAAVYGMPTIATISALTAIPDAINESKYKKALKNKR